MLLDEQRMSDGIDGTRLEYLAAVGERTHLDRLHVRAARQRIWSFVSYSSVVVHALSHGVSLRHPGRSRSVMEPGELAVLAPFDAQLEITTIEGASFQVLEGLSAVQERATANQSTFDVDARPVDVFVAATRKLLPLPTRRFSRAVEHARDYIAANVAINFSLDALGAVVAINRYELCRRFHQQVGMPPYRFRNHLRVARARALLAAGVECTEVAYAAGFCDQSHLNRAFKEHMGTTPGAYARASACGAWARAA